MAFAPQARTIDRLYALNAGFAVQPDRSVYIELMDGDFDIFGDGSVKVISTPGHTSGHCSLLVRLARTRPVFLSSDVAHYRYNMEHRCVPTLNWDPEQSRISMERVDAVVREEHAQLWLNHDTVQSATIPHAPAYFD
jgi:glyoxylase-like metal-dependent hydrolase (beta-lactamase superfamily II)